MKIPRFYADLGPFLKPNKVLVIYGPRQVGKTTLLKDFLASCPWKYRLDSGEDVRVQEVFQSRDGRAIQESAAGNELIAIDEAQKIPGSGEALKILVDQVPGLRVIATGSSSFELAGQVGEPLTGRKLTLTLFPVAQMELGELFTPFELRERLEDGVGAALPELSMGMSHDFEVAIAEGATMVRVGTAIFGSRH